MRGGEIPVCWNLIPVYWNMKEQTHTNCADDLSLREGEYTSSNSLERQHHVSTGKYHET